MDDIRVKNTSARVDHRSLSPQHSEAAPKIAPVSKVSKQPMAALIRKFARLHAPKKTILALAAIILLSSAGIGYYYLHRKPAVVKFSLPANIVSGVNFPLYVPAKLPPDYHYNIGSANIRNGILFYKLSSGTKIITITEQPLPPVDINLTDIKSYSDLKVPAGRAAIGISVGNPAVIILTDTTMVNINSTKGTPKDVVSELAQSISLLPPKSSY